MNSKLAGDSPLKLIMVTSVIIFFVALFAWQIEKYLAVTYDSKLQAQIVQLDQLIQASNLDAFGVNKYAYLHAPDDRNKPLVVDELAVNFKPASTLDSFMLANGIRVSSSSEDLCYWYFYFPPNQAREQFDFYDNREAAYLLAAWSDLNQKPYVGASTGVDTWALNNLTRSDFFCEPRNLSPSKLATNINGEVHELPGINFQFSEFGYSKVKL